MATSLCGQECKEITASEMLHMAVSWVTKNDGFALSTSPSKVSIKTAEKLLEWRIDDKEAWSNFSTKLLACLNSCFVDVTDLQKFKKQREQMWAKYHQVRSCQAFRDSGLSF